MAKPFTAVAWPLLLCTAGTSLSTLASSPIATSLTIIGTGGVTFAASYLGTLLSGAAGSAFHEVSKAFGEGMLSKLFDRRPAIKENHIVLQALRHAQLEALKAIREEFDKTWKWKPGLDTQTRQTSDRFSTALASFIEKQGTEKAILAFAKCELAPPDEEKLRQAVINSLPAGLDKGLAMRQANNGGTETAAQRDAAIRKTFEDIRKTAETAVLAEFQQSAPDLAHPPGTFTTLIAGSVTTNGWFDFFLRDAADRLKTSEGQNPGEFEKIWQTEQAAITRAIVETVAETVDRIETKLGHAETAAARRHREAMEAAERQTEELRKLREEIAREKGVAAELLLPLFEDLGQTGLSLDEIRTRARDAIEAIRERARQAVEKSNDGADIEAAIRAARDKLGKLDTAGSRKILADKIADEKAARLQRLIPLLEEQAAIQRLTYDYNGAIETLKELIELDANQTWRWIDLGDIFVTTGVLNDALAAFRQALEAAGRLAKADPANAVWQRDLSVSHVKVGDVHTAQGDLPAALKSYQDSYAIFERLAQADPANAEWQRDLSVSHNKIGNVHIAQGDLPAALKSYQADLAIADRLAKADPANAGWQRDLSVAHNKIGDVQAGQGDLQAARKSYQDSLAIRDRLDKADPANTGWLRDLSVSHNKIGNVHIAQGDLPAALKSYQADLAIADRLAKADPANAGWQRDLAVSFGNVAVVEAKQGLTSQALAGFRRGREIIAQLMQKSPDNATLPKDLARFDWWIAALEKP